MRPSQLIVTPDPPPPPLDGNGERPLSVINTGGDRLTFVIHGLNLGWLSDLAIGSTRLHDCVDYRCQRVLLERLLQRWKMISLR